MVADLFSVLDGGADVVPPFPLGRGKKKATDQQITDAYEIDKNIWKVAARFGMCGQSVHERLVRLKKNTPRSILTDADKSRLVVEYSRHADAGTSAKLAETFGRDRFSLAKLARSLGLTDAFRKRPYNAGIGAENIRRRIAAFGHPRGMLGKKHTMAVRIRISDSSFERWHSLSKAEQIAIVSKSHAAWKQGWRKIGGVRKFYRSRWEANYARYLEWLRVRGEITSWVHEPETFWFEKIRRGTRSYLPDFRVVQDGYTTYHEVKGWMDDRSKTKLARMAKYHPHIEIILIEAKQYKSIAKVVAPMIPDWE